MFKKFRIRDYVGIGMVLSLREPGDTLPKVEARVEATIPISYREETLFATPRSTYLLESICRCY